VVRLELLSACGFRIRLSRRPFFFARRHTRHSLFRNFLKSTITEVIKGRKKVRSRGLQHFHYILACEVKGSSAPPF
jgi:hypothetical protein